MADRVLVVEDDARLAGMLSEYLGEAGFRVAIAATGADAIARSQDEHAAMILDLTLPDIDGLDVCRAVRAKSDGSDCPCQAAIQNIWLSSWWARALRCSRGSTSGPASKARIARYMST